MLVRGPVQPAVRLGRTGRDGAQPAPIRAAVRRLALERQPQFIETPKASAIFGQILELVRY
jgi:hypothetical protein